MRSRTYQRGLEAHLTAYKLTRLGVSEKGTYTFRGRSLEYGHILPKHLAWLNVPEPFRTEIRDYVTRKRIKLHKYFHHLNSSQAFAFALFVPYLTVAPQVLAAALVTRTIQEWDLERIVDSSEGTNVDAWWRSEDRSETYCEVKLSETAFGAADDDYRHRRKLTAIYGPGLRPYVQSGLLEPGPFLENYQILRNLWLACRKGHESDRVTFLLPRANAKPNAQLKLVLDSVHPSLRARVDVLHIEDVLADLTTESTDYDLRWYAKLLTEKYLPTS